MPELNRRHFSYNAAMPLVFSGTTGHFMPARNEKADAGVAVLFVSAWGFEEMSSRRFARQTAEVLADQNIASLRFDFPGTGDSVLVPSDEEGLRVWHDAIKTAADELHQRTQYERLIVVAQSSGALVVSKVLKDLPGLHGCVLINPVMSGRHYLREVSVWSSVIDDNLEIPAQNRDRLPGSIAGLKMPLGIAVDMKGLKFTKIDADSQIRVLAMRPNGSPILDADQLVSGAKVDFDQIEFPGFREMVANVTISKVPLDVVSNLVDWISHSKLPPRANRSIVPFHKQKAQLRDDGFVETHVRFGQSENLSGALCLSMNIQSDTAVLFLTTAYERHVSWGRMHLHLARALAKQGITSFRFDAASVGDSPCRPGAPEQVLYSDWLKLDVKEAINFLESKGFRKVVLAARCSGGYVAFQSALTDPRVRGLVTVNQDAFFWPEGKPVDELLKFVPKDFHKYATKLMDFGTLRRLWNGDINVSVAIRNIGSEFLRRCGNALEPVFVFDRAQSDAIKKTKSGFNSLSKRNVLFTLLYGEGDIGLRAVVEVFGNSHQKLKQFGNVELKIMPECDHNLSQAHSRQTYMDAITSAVKRIAMQKDEAPAKVMSRPLEVVTATFAGITAGFHSFESKVVQLFQII